MESLKTNPIMPNANGLIKNKFNVIVSGHLCLDIFPDVSRCNSEQFQKGFVPGHLINVGSMTFSTGGAVSNTGITLHKLGICTQLMGKVGNDTLGQIVRHILAAHSPHLGEGIIIDPKVDTSYTIVISPPGVDRIFLHNPGANDTYSAEDVCYSSLNDVRLFHFGYPPLMKMMYAPQKPHIAEIFRLAKETGVTTSLDMAFPDADSPAGKANWRSILESTLPYVDIFMPSIEEILFMLYRSVYDELQKKAIDGDILPFITPTLLSGLCFDLLNMGAKIIGLKLGHRGFYIRTANYSVLNGMGRAKPSHLESWTSKELWVPCFVVDVIGTAGAGDATIGGFLSGLLHDLTLEQTMEAALAVGACCVEATDTTSGIRSWEQTLHRIENGWQKRTLDLILHD